MTAAVRLGLAWLLGAAAGAPAEAPTLERIMAEMAAVPGVRAEFHEVKEIGLLEEPIETRGRLYFAPPDRLARHTTHPDRSVLVVDGHRLSLRDAAGSTEVDLSADPVARELVSNLVVLLRGDLEALRARYTVDFRAGADGSWELGLVPRREAARRLLTRIALRGERRTLREMEVAERDGDRTRTRFREVETGRPFTPEEMRALFSTQ